MNKQQLEELGRQLMQQLGEPSTEYEALFWEGIAQNNPDLVAGAAPFCGAAIVNRYDYINEREARTPLGEALKRCLQFDTVNMVALLRHLGARVDDAFSPQAFGTLLVYVQETALAVLPQLLKNADYSECERVASVAYSVHQGQHTSEANEASLQVLNACLTQMPGLRHDMALRAIKDCNHSVLVLPVWEGYDHNNELETRKKIGREPAEPLNYFGSPEVLAWAIAHGLDALDQLEFYARLGLVERVQELCTAGISAEVCGDIVNRLQNASPEKKESLGDSLEAMICILQAHIAQAAIA